MCSVVLINEKVMLLASAAPVVKVSLHNICQNSFCFVYVFKLFLSFSSYSMFPFHCLFPPAFFFFLLLPFWFLFPALITTPSFSLSSLPLLVPLIIKMLLCIFPCLSSVFLFSLLHCHFLPSFLPRACTLWLGC